jgi:hypothetical protein
MMLESSIGRDRCEDNDRIVVRPLDRTRKGSAGRQYRSKGDTEVSTIIEGRGRTGIGG